METAETLPIHDAEDFAGSSLKVRPAQTASCFLRFFSGSQRDDNGTRSDCSLYINKRDTRFPERSRREADRKNATFFRFLPLYNISINRIPPNDHLLHFTKQMDRRDNTRSRSCKPIPTHIGVSRFSTRSVQKCLGRGVSFLSSVKIPGRRLAIRPQKRVSNTYGGSLQSRRKNIKFMDMLLSLPLQHNTIEETLTILFSYPIQILFKIYITKNVHVPGATSTVPAACASPSNDGSVFPSPNTSGLPFNVITVARTFPFSPASV